jgi:hypothetical protein
MQFDSTVEVELQQYSTHHDIAKYKLYLKYPDWLRPNAHNEQHLHHLFHNRSNCFTNGIAILPASLLLLLKQKNQSAKAAQQLARLNLPQIEE